MDILQICLIGVIGAIVALILKQYKPEFAVIVSLAAGIVILFIVSEYIFEAVEVVSGISEKTGIDNAMLSAVMKIIGVGYLTEFSSNICEDSGNKSIADKIALGGKIIILITALPILTAVVDVISVLVS